MNTNTSKRIYKSDRILVARLEKLSYKSTYGKLLPTKDIKYNNKTTWKDFFKTRTTIVKTHINKSIKNCKRKS